MICDNFWCKAICHRRPMATLIVCWRLAESDVTVMPSFTCVIWLHWWCNQADDVVPPSTTLAFVTQMNEKPKYTSPSAVQVKNQQKTICIEEKFDVRNEVTWKSEWFGDISLDINIHTLCDNADKIIKSA
jgi:hypothetical protein